MKQDYYTALARVVMASARNDPRLRGIIYDLARHKLRRQVASEISEFRDADGSEHLVALEGAIEQIEANLARGIPTQIYSEHSNRPPRARGTIEIIPPSHRLPLHEFGGESTPQRIAGHIFSFRSMLPFIGLIIFAALAYLTFQREFARTNLAAEPQANTLSRDTPNGLPGIPVPSSYGVYAIANGQLVELEPLPIRVPDGRMAVSATIATKSTTRLANGRIQFVVFKRDLINNAPEKAAVRVLACVICVGSAEETTTNIAGETWAIRDMSYEMKVAPVRSNPAMIILRAAAADFSFPAGRYCLVLKGVAYDFSVEPDLKKP
jgi:hypothetical protein